MHTIMFVVRRDNITNEKVIIRNLQFPIKIAEFKLYLGTCQLIFYENLTPLRYSRQSVIKASNVPIVGSHQTLSNGCSKPHVNLDSRRGSFQKVAASMDKDDVASACRRFRNKIGEYT
ncbi:unnamed protein product [Lepeophtheirus salmonis]|uniref:(salmon louse) hypothetical protein n=1 Tax=Lepeophtheirus salmonis TaxID=72036 RepID=A0A7R8D6A2_LEPSM|nr:unnamed protein product [Lepeophtheirus salmonis]CAF3041810.1 unnamed protein product [Lepeophtheirus salmonis]